MGQKGTAWVSFKVSEGGSQLKGSGGSIGKALGRVGANRHLLHGGKISAETAKHKGRRHGKRGQKGGGRLNFPYFSARAVIQALRSSSEKGYVENVRKEKCRSSKRATFQFAITGLTCLPWRGGEDIKAMMRGLSGKKGIGWG